jgi:hypothetical protein
MDGQPMTTTTQGVPASIYNGTAHLTIGMNQEPGGTSYFSGSLDDIRVYNRALSAAEVAALYGILPDGGVAADSGL